MDKKKLEFNAQLETTYSFFKDKAYLIPAYQRDYAWDTEQWIQLWQDLDNYRNNSNEQHFLGPVILTESESEEGYNEVIDGQQRLTTLQIIIGLIRDRWINLGDGFTNQNGVPVPNKQLTSELIYSLTPRVRYNLIPNRYLIEIFKDYVQKNRENESQQSSNSLKTYKYYEHATELIRAIKFFKDKIFQLDEVELSKFQKYVLEKTNILKIEAGGSSNAFLLFETLNYRGLELSQTDLVKTYLFSKLKQNDATDKLIQDWDSIIENLNNMSPDIFLRHYLLLFNTKIKKRDIYGEVKERYITEEDSLSFIKDLMQYSNIYSYINRTRKIDGSKKGVLNSVFDDLSALKVDTHSIFLLAVLKKFKADSNNYDSKRIESAVRIAEVMSFRWTTCGRNAQDLENIYQSAAFKLMKATDIDKTFDLVSEEILSKLPSDEEFFTSITNAVIKSNSRAKYILKRIDQYQTGGGAYVLLHDGILHLEHVAPKNPRSETNWREKMKGTQNYSEIIYKIGNLALIPEALNIKYKDYPFVAKKSEYEKMKSKGKRFPELTETVFEFKDWNQSSVNERTIEIAKYAVKVWNSESTKLEGKIKERKKTVRKKTARKKSKTKKRKTRRK